MKQSHKDQLVGFLFAVGNLIAYLLPRSITLNSIFYYYFSTIFCTFIFPPLSIFIYFLLRRKRTMQFTSSVALCNIALIFPTASVSYIFIDTSYFGYLLNILIISYLPVLIDLIATMISKLRTRKAAAQLPIPEVAPAPVVNEVVANTRTQHSILRGMIYAAAFMLVNWAITIALFSTPYYNSAHVVFFMFFGWLTSIPFYFILKQNSTIAYLFSALISIIVMTKVCYRSLLLLSDTNLFSHFSGWDGLILLVPMIALPIYALMPIVIDGIIYIGKAIYRAITKPKTKHNGPLTGKETPNEEIT